MNGKASESSIAWECATGGYDSADPLAKEAGGGKGGRTDTDVSTATCDSDDIYLDRQRIAKQSNIMSPSRPAVASTTEDPCQQRIGSTEGVSPKASPRSGDDATDAPA